MKKLVHAVESRRPKARYYVTLATPMFATLNRFMPRGLYDRLLYWASDQ